MSMWHVAYSTCVCGSGGEAAEGAPDAVSRESVGQQLHNTHLKGHVPEPSCRCPASRTHIADKRS